MMPFYLRKYDPDILQSLTVEHVDKEKGTFRYRIVFYDPTDDDPDHPRDETGLVKKTATGIGTFTFIPGLSPEEAEEEDDTYPELESVSYGGLDVSPEMAQYVWEEIDSCIQ